MKTYKSDIIQESINTLEEFLNRHSVEELNQIFAEIKKMDFEGPTYADFKHYLATGHYYSPAHVLSSDVLQDENFTINWKFLSPTETIVPEYKNAKQELTEDSDKFSVAA